MTEALQKIGTRICIIGRSSSGKSTLAVKLGEKLGIKVFHLDTIAHKENSHWERRPEKDFVSDHDDLIKLDCWVMEGNYSACMPQRFARSTAVIWLDPPFVGFLWRYIKRCLQNDPSRAGNLKGAQRQFSWWLIRFTLFGYPKNKVKYNKLLEDYNKPFIKIKSIKELNRHYEEWGIRF